MAELKTKKTKESVDKFLASVQDESTRQDCLAIAGIMKKISGTKPKMWGSSIVGFGDYRYKYASGREGDWFITGFSPRKGNISIYLMPGLEVFKDTLGNLGKHKEGKGCLYIKSLNDIDTNVLKTLIKNSLKEIKARYK